MNREDFEKLVNREIDGLLTPEEEASLNDYTSRDSAAAHEQRSLHKIHRAFQQMDRHETPVGLADRIADHVLSEPAPMRRFSTLGMLNKVAATILVITVIGFGGWWIGSANQVAAGEQDEVRILHQWQENTLQLWQDSYGLTKSQAWQIVEIKRPFLFRATDEANKLECEARVLTKLEEFGLLERYCKKTGTTLQEAGALIERAAKTK